MFSTIWRLLFLPINLLLFLSIPDMRRVDEQVDKLFRKLYPASFFMCMAWIGAISYVVTWMITLIGFDIGVPDSVMGLLPGCWNIHPRSLLQSACYQAGQSGYG